MKSDFLNNFKMDKTLENALNFFVKNYPFNDVECRKEFAKTIMADQIIKKDISSRKLLELLNQELVNIHSNLPLKENKSQRQETSGHLTIYDIDKLNGSAFQDMIVNLLQANGFVNVKVIGKSGDQGGDVVATKNDEQLVIQAKRYSIDNKVSNNAVQEVLGAIAVYGANRGIVVTNSFYTASAKTLAKFNNIELWDRRTVEDFLEAYNSNIS